MKVVCKNRGEFVRLVKLEDAKPLVDAVNNAKTQREHDAAKLILKGYKMRTDQEGLMWPGADLDLSLPDDDRPVCCGEYLDWTPMQIPVEDV